MYFYNSQEADFAKWACRKNNRNFCLRSVNYFHFKNVIYKARDLAESWMSATLYAMANFSDLPSEIWHLIAQYLPRIQALGTQMAQQFLPQLLHGPQMETSLCPDRQF
jgi:hypothetical protein